MNTPYSETQKIFQLSLSFKDPLRQRLASAFQGRLDNLLLLNRLNAIYLRIAEKGEPTGFIGEALRHLHITYDAAHDDLASVPKTGPLLVVANHPFGGIEGLILISLLLKIRPDAKIMANYLLGRIPELHPMLICVDPFGTERAVAKNLKPLREAVRWLKAGHVLAVFPAGAVSHLDLRVRRIIDPKWHKSMAAMVHRSGAHVLPVFFEGKNSVLFQLAGMMHPKLRTALLPHEFLNKANKTIKVRIGNPISFGRLTGFQDDEKLVTYLRMRTYALKHRSLVRAGRRPTMEAVDVSDGRKPVSMQGTGADSIIREVGSLPCDQLLVRGDGCAVFHARAHQIPNLLFEIGRLRETAFRRNGEGTGKRVDLDRFDLFYTHLFVWHEEKKEVVGAYRLGLVDLIHERFGRNGLYTSTLFDYKESFLGYVACAIELGRSFVRPEYQKLYSPLLLLWKGIARFVALNPRYTILFGPVTISNDYSALSKQLMVSYLTANHYAPDLARLIKPRTPLRSRSLRRLGIEDRAAIPADLDDLSSLVSDIEADRKGVPVLLRQYVKLGGRLMGFNIDPSFGNGLDGLILVDLLKCDRKILSRYMGKDGADGFFRYHEERQADLAS